MNERSRSAQLPWTMASMGAQRIVGFRSQLPRITSSGPKHGPSRGHYVPRVRAREAVVHPLSLLQAGVRHLDAAGRGIGASEREGPEIGGDGRHGRHGGTLESDRPDASEVKAGEFSLASRPATGTRSSTTETRRQIRGDHPQALDGDQSEILGVQQLCRGASRDHRQADRP